MSGKNGSGSSKSVVVIGGTGGIGHAIAQRYADAGCDVVITGRANNHSPKLRPGRSASVQGGSFAFMTSRRPAGRR